MHNKSEASSPDVATLIRSAIEKRAISKAEFVRTLGYSNVSKGLRRLDELLAGNPPADFLLPQLTRALAVDGPRLACAVRATNEKAKAQNEATALACHHAWVAAFRPYAVILTSKSIPSPVFAAIALGPRKLLCIELDEERQPETFMDQVLQKLPSWLAEDGTVPCFGKPTGFVVNYEPTWSVEFDLDGRALRTMDTFCAIDGGSFCLA